MTDSEKMDIILQEITGMKTEMADMKTEITGMKTEMADMKTEITGMKTEMADMKTEITGMKTEMADMKTEITGMKTEMADMKTEMTDMKKEVKDTKVHIENVTDNNIRIIAEGHTDLTRKLDDALKVNNEKELLLIRMSYLEDEVRRIKERLAQIA